MTWAPDRFDLASCTYYLSLMKSGKLEPLGASLCGALLPFSDYMFFGSAPHLNIFGCAALPILIYVLDIKLIIPFSPFKLFASYLQLISLLINVPLNFGTSIRQNIALLCLQTCTTIHCPAWTELMVFLLRSVVFVTLTVVSLWAAVCQGVVVVVVTPTHWLRPHIPHKTPDRNHGDNS